SQRNDDEFWKTLGQALPRQIDSSVERRRIGIEEDVGLLQHRKEDCAGRGVLEVERDAEFVGVQKQMEPSGLQIAPIVAKGPELTLLRANPRRLDLDNFSSEIGERLRRHRRRQKWHRVEAGKFDHAKALERFGQRLAAHTGSP